MTSEESEYVRTQLEAEYRRGWQDGIADWQHRHMLRTRPCGKGHTDAETCGMRDCAIAPPMRRRRKHGA